MNSVVLTNLIAEFHQLLNALLVGMVLLPVLEADRIDDQMRMNVLPVNMSCHYNFIFVERFLRKLHCNLVCKLRFNLIPTRKTLHQMIIQPARRFCGTGS